MKNLILILLSSLLPTFGAVSPGFTIIGGPNYEFLGKFVGDGSGLTNLNGGVYINVTDYGADKTGIKDSTTNIQAAINIAITSSNGVLVFPGGTYKITSLDFKGNNVTNGTSGLTIDGGQGQNHTMIIGGENGYPMFDMINCSALNVRNFNFQPTEGIHPSCAILIGRSGTQSSGIHTFQSIVSEGNYEVSSVYGIASEQNHFINCTFSQFPSHTNTTTTFYSGKTAANRYSSDIKSHFHTLSSTGAGGNGGNIYDHCQFRNYTTSNPSSSSMVIEFGQNTSVRSSYFVTGSATNQVVLIGSTTGLFWEGNFHEKSPTQPYASIAILDTNTYQGISIKGSIYPIYASDGSQISGLDIQDTTLVSSTPSTQFALDVYNIKNSKIRFSKQLTPFGGNVTGFNFHVRGLSPDNVDFGTQFLSAEVQTVSPNTNLVTHYGNQYVPNMINGGTLISDSVNNVVGYSFGAFVNRTTGVRDVQLGNNALIALTSSSDSLGIGDSAGFNVTTEDKAIMIGSGSRIVPGAINTTAIGTGAVATNSNSIIIGGAGQNQLYTPAYITAGGVTAQGSSGFTTLNGNIFLASTTNGSGVGVIYKDGTRWAHDYANPASVGQSLYIGRNSGNFTMSALAIRNTATGDATLNKITDGHQIVAIGTGAGANDTTGSLHVFAGVNSGIANTTGNNHVIVGDEAYQYGTIGDGMTVVGDHGLNSVGITNITSITAIGRNTSIAANGITDSSSIGAVAAITKSHQVVLGSPTTTEITATNANVASLTVDAVNGYTYQGTAISGHYLRGHGSTNYIDAVLNASDIGAGTVPQINLPINVVYLEGTNLMTGTNIFAGQVNATNINNVLSGTIISTNIAYLNGTNNFTGTNSFSGISILNNAANTISGVGTGLTALNASNLSSGTAPTARLGSGSATSSTYLAGDSTWKSISSFGYPTLNFSDTDTHNLMAMSEIDLVTYNLAGNTLSAEGDTLDFWSTGSSDNTSNNQVRFYFGTKVLVFNIPAATGVEQWSLVGHVMRTTSSANQKLYATLVTPTHTDTLYDTGTIDMTSTVTVRITGESDGSANNVIFNMWKLSGPIH